MTDVFQSVLQELKDIKENPESLSDAYDQVDRALLGVIKIERRHLYGMEHTSTQRRRKEIEDYLDKEFKHHRESKDVS